MPASLPPEDEIARLRVEMDQGASYGPGCRPDGSSPQAVSPPHGASIPRAKAKADPDAIIAEYLSAYEQANGRKLDLRLVYEAGWVHFRSRASSMTWYRKRLKTLGDMTQRLLDRANVEWLSRDTPAPGIEARQGGDNSVGSVEDESPTRREAPDSLQTQSGREGGESAP